MGSRECSAPIVLECKQGSAGGSVKCIALGEQHASNGDGNSDSNVSHEQSVRCNDGLS